MKNVLFLALALFILISSHAGAKNPNEKKLHERSNEISLPGQVDFVKEMVSGEDPKKPTSGGDDPWGGTALFLGMLWGSIGTGFFVYGKKQSRFLFLLCGIALCVFPLVVSSNTTNLILGIILTILPFKVDL